MIKSAPKIPYNHNKNAITQYNVCLAMNRRRTLLHASTPLMSTYKEKARCLFGCEKRKRKVTARKLNDGDMSKNFSTVLST